MATAEAFQIVSEESLEGGEGGSILTAACADSTLVVGALGATAAIMLAVEILTLKPWTYMGFKGGCSGGINAPPIPALLPTAFHSIVRARRKQKAQLELNSIGAVGKHIEYGLPGRIAKIELRITEEAVEPRFIVLLRCSRPLEPTER
ncbi:(3S)-malyl-CoA thioesterase [Babesia caballi]|uniref:(3S)-malyl-CoA thioesterase n=1 Tax=Babesia caballi TaxID=5871 RepID=A0AAV4LS77_BABCB|nr:(3S)-malyl-CoA thioesterase [Babesia caballi]